MFQACQRHVSIRPTEKAGRIVVCADQRMNATIKPGTGPGALTGS